MLDAVLIDQLRVLFKDLNSQFILDSIVDPNHRKRTELLETLDDLASCSPHITTRNKDGEGLQFVILKDGKDVGIKFRCTPNGHEFSSLVLAILNSDGKGKTLPDENIISRIRQLNGPVHLLTYVNLTCLICSEVVQMLNAITIYSDQIQHEIVDGGINKMEVIEKQIMNLPSVYADGELILIGRACYNEILDKLEAKYGTH